MDIVHVFARNVRRYRKSLNLSQEEFAERCGLHRTYISAVEREQRSISLKNIQRIADALHVDTYRLFIEYDSEASEANASDRAKGSSISGSLSMRVVDNARGVNDESSERVERSHA